MSMIAQLCGLSFALVCTSSPAACGKATGLQADRCIIMQIATLVNTKNVRTTPLEDNQPLLRWLSSRLDHRDLTSPFPIWLSRRQWHTTPAQSMQRWARGILSHLTRRVLSAAVYVKRRVWKVCHVTRLFFRSRHQS